MKSLIYSLLLISILFSCQQKDIKTEKKQEQVEIAIDSTLYKKMVTDKPISFVDPFHTYAGSEVEFYRVYSPNSKPDIWKFAYATLRNDTLWINVKEASAMLEMFGGNGISFMVADKKITSEYYKWSDVIVDGKDLGEVSIPASENSLTLNTDKFAVGDTIAGKLTFKELGSMYASGYFRAIIKGDW